MILNISDLDIDMIMEARKTFLVSNGQKWVKKENPEIDVTMGAYDGAEISENVGLYLLSEIDKIEGIEAGLYRDDGLAVSDLPKRVIEHRVKSKLIDIFKENDLKIVVDTNLTIVNFLNVTFNLENRTFKPYRKPDNDINYINKESNHPPCTKKNIPISTNKLINSLSSDKEIFDNAAEK